MPWKKTVYASWFAQILSITGFSIVLPFLPYYVRELGVVGDAEVARWAGYVCSSAAVTLALFAPVWGMLADRYGRKPMVMRSMFGGAIVLVLMGFSRSVGELIVYRLIQGGLTGTVTASIALVACAAPRERSAYALGMMQAAVFIGMSVGPLIGGVVADHFGYRAAFMVAASLLAAGGLLVQFAVKENFTFDDTAGKAERGNYGEVFAAVGFMAAISALCALRFANSIGHPVFPLLVEQIRGSSEGINTTTGGIMAAGGLAAALSAGVLGRFSDALGHKRILIWFSLYTAVVALLYTQAQSVAHLFVLRLFFGLGAAGVTPAANAIIRNITHDRNIGKAYGVTSSLGAIGWMLGPFAGGYVAASFNLRTPFYLMSAALVVAAVLVACSVKADPPRAQPSDS